MLRAININNKYISESDFIKKVSNFLYSDYYFLSLIILTTIMWGLGQVASGSMIVISLTIMLLLIAFVVVIQRDIMPVYPLIFFTMFALSSPKLPPYMWVVAIPAGLLVIAALFHIVYYKIEEFKFGKLFFPMVLFFIAILLGGIGSRFPVNPLGTWLGGVLLVIAPLFVYFITMNYVENNGNLRTYVAKTTLYFGLTMTIHLFIYYIFKPETLLALADVPHLGYGISNTVATYFLITAPMGFYLYTQTKSKLAYAYLFMGLIEFGSIVLTTSRGGTLFGALEFVVTAIVTIFVVDKQKRKEYFIFAGIMLVLAGVLFGAMYRKILGFISHVFSDGMQDSGRFELYREAIARFFEHPIFGVGLGYIGKMDTVFNTVGIYMFHNTLLQYAADLGLVGLCALAYLYFARLEILFEKWDLYSVFMLMAFIGFEGYSLLNTGTVQGYPTAILITVLYVAHEKDTEQVESKVYATLINKLKEKSKLLVKKQEA
ncbi:MAG: O-antigen ligase family protein [Clostridiales bacterium]|nr:O-antigen ligase family protein [Clostridiales bacterium]